MFIFPEIGRSGRLGNQMFQLAAIKSLSLRNNSQVYLPEDLDTRVADGQTCLLKFFKHKIPFISYKDCKDIPVFIENLEDDKEETRKITINKLLSRGFIDCLVDACKGDMYSQYILGMNFYHGINSIPKDILVAIYWLEKSAEQKLPHAQFILGTIYYYNNELCDDKKKANKLLNLAAKQYHTPARLFMLELYYENNITDIDIEWLKIGKGKINQEFFNLAESYALEGHYESELYFSEYKEEIKSIFEFVDEIQDFSTMYISLIKELNPGKEIVGIHFRRGDYLETTSVPTLFLNFFYTAKNTYFNENKYIFLVFTGGSTENKNSNESDMNWCKRNIPNVSFCEVNDAIKDLAIMTKCDHMILTTKSTLGWWGGYLNKNPSKKIVVPGISIGPIFNPDIFWPKEFIQIN
jgi:glutaredoxin